MYSRIPFSIPHLNPCTVIPTPINSIPFYLNVLKLIIYILKMFYDQIQYINMLTPRYSRFERPDLTPSATQRQSKWNVPPKDFEIIIDLAIVPLVTRLMLSTPLHSIRYCYGLAFGWTKHFILRARLLYRRCEGISIKRYKTQLNFNWGDAR